MTLNNHYRLVSVLLILASLMGLAGAVMMGLLMSAFACDNPPHGDSMICYVIGGGFFLILALFLALPPLWAAIGLLRYKAKSRRLALICAGVLCVLFIPIGTIAGAYILYVLLKLDPDQKFFGQV